MTEGAGRVERPEWVRVVGTPAMELVVDEIATERARQFQCEGWTPGHDDLHSCGEMAGAAACYAMHGVTIHEDRLREDTARMVSDLWPWSTHWWKPVDRRRDLIRAAALIVAEIERLDRIKQPADAPTPATEVE